MSDEGDGLDEGNLGFAVLNNEISHARQCDLMMNVRFVENF